MISNHQSSAHTDLAMDVLVSLQQDKLCVCLILRDSGILESHLIARAPLRMRASRTDVTFERSPPLLSSSARSRIECSSHNARGNLKFFFVANNRSTSPSSFGILKCVSTRGANLHSRGRRCQWRLVAGARGRINIAHRFCRPESFQMAA
jgi:hypothetical protein